MNYPWHHQTGLAKAATILAVALMLSLGLCGLNTAVWLTITGHSAHPALQNILFRAAYLELAAILLSGTGLTAVALLLLFQILKAALTKKK